MKAKHVSPRSLPIVVRQTTNRQCQPSHHIIMEQQALSRQERARQLYRELSLQCQWYNLVMSVEEDPLILWQTIHGGKTLMHAAAGLLRKAQIGCGGGAQDDEASAHGFDFAPCGGATATSGDLWKWILQKACCRYENFLLKHDKAGETCIDSFMSAWIGGGTRLGQPRCSRMIDFPKAVEAILSCDDKVDSLRAQLKSPRPLEEMTCGIIIKESNRAEGRISHQVAMVARVVRALELLSRAAVFGLVGLEAEEDKDDETHEFSILAFVSQTGRCPDLFARLLLRLYPEQVLGKDSQGYIPLHRWAMGSKAADEELSEGLLRALLAACPDTATCTTIYTGQIALHLALTNNKPLKEVQILWSYAPFSLGCRDPVTGFFPFALAAMACKVELRELVRGFHKRGPCVKLFEWLDATRDMDVSEEEASSYLLGSIYDMIRSFPQALHHSLSES